MKTQVQFPLDAKKSEALVGNDRRPRETWVRSLSQTGFTGNFTVVPTDGWVTGLSPEVVVDDSGYSRSTPFVQWVPRECSGLICWLFKKKYHTYYLIRKTKFKELGLLDVEKGSPLRMIRHVGVHISGCAG